MAIVWGKKKVEKRLGYVADFCPICREINPFLVLRIGVADHIYYVPLGEGKVLGHLGECNKCKTKIPVNPIKYKTFFISLGNSLGNDIEKLIVETYPAIRSDNAERLDLERKIKDHFIFSHAEREFLVTEPFKYLASRVEERYKNSRFDKESGLGCLLTISFMTLFWCLFAITPQSGTLNNIFCTSTGLVFCLGLIYTVIQLMLAPNRFIQREIIPLLVKALLPLNPKQYELEQCLNQLRNTGSRLGKKINDQELWEQLQKTRNHY